MTFQLEKAVLLTRPGSKSFVLLEFQSPEPLIEDGYPAYPARELLCQPLLGRKHLSTICCILQSTPVTPRTILPLGNTNGGRGGIKVEGGVLRWKGVRGRHYIQYVYTIWHYIQYVYTIWETLTKPSILFLLTAYPSNSKKHHNILQVYLSHSFLPFNPASWLRVTSVLRKFLDFVVSTFLYEISSDMMVKVWASHDIFVILSFCLLSFCLLSFCHFLFCHFLLSTMSSMGSKQFKIQCVLPKGVLWIKIQALTHMQPWGLGTTSYDILGSEH